jgi:hypothetical protein
MRLFPSDQEGVPMAWAKKIARAMTLAEVYTNVEVKVKERALPRMKSVTSSHHVPRFPTKKL